MLNTILLFVGLLKEVEGDFSTGNDLPQLGTILVHWQGTISMYVDVEVQGSIACGGQRFF